jgi:hypothetical protein
MTVGFSADLQPPTKAAAAPAAPLLQAGSYAGSWKSTSDSSGRLQIKLKRDGGEWLAQASFTYEDTEIATKMKSVKIEGAKIELVFEWEIQGTSGQSKIVGEAAGDKLQGTYESTTPSETSNGTWTVTRT